jgi:hypothetical protein
MAETGGSARIRKCDHRRISSRLAQARTTASDLQHMNPMPIDTHVRIAAILHIVMAGIALPVLLVIGAIVAAVGTSLGLEREVAAWIGGVGVLVFALLALIVIAEIIGAVLLLRGSELGRAMTLVFSALHLINIPIGTAIGAYSLWALLREVPQPQPASAPPRQDAAQSF